MFLRFHRHQSTLANTDTVDQDTSSPLPTKKKQRRKPQEHIFTDLYHILVLPGHHLLIPNPIHPVRSFYSQRLNSRYTSTIVDMACSM